MEVNVYVLIGMLIRLFIVVAISVIVLPQQIHELLTKRNERLLRWLGIVSSCGFILFSVLPVMYQNIRLDTPGEFNLLNIASVSGNFSILMLALPIIVSYYLIKRRANKKDA